MRLPPIPPHALGPDLRAVHDAIVERVGNSLSAVVSLRDDGALVGPFPPLLHFPQFGVPAWHFLNSLLAHARLPKQAREVAILVVGAAFGARYEIYAHEIMGEAVGLAPEKVASIAAGQRPSDLSEEEAVAYDVAAALAAGGSLPATTYARATRAFGTEQVGELVFLVGSYCLISVMLNAFDVSIPEGS